MNPILLVLFVFFPSARAEEPRLATERVILHTNYGDMTLGFYPDVAPRHVQQILRLVELGFYEDSEIFRIEPGFVAQVENFNMRKIPLAIEKQQAVGKIPAEFSAVPHVRGTLSMARLEDINSAESSFSLVLGDSPHLNGHYTVFGKILAGMETLTAIEKVAVDEHAHPKTIVKINHAEVVRGEQAPTSKPYWLPIAGIVMLFLIVILR